MRDLFEAGLNEAAASLAAIYGRSSSVRSVERGFAGWAVGSIEGVGEVWRVIVAKSGGHRDDFSGIHRATSSSASDEAQVRGRAPLDCQHIDVGRAWKRGSWVRRHEVSQRGVGCGGERCSGHEPTSTMRPPQHGQMSILWPVSCA